MTVTHMLRQEDRVPTARTGAAGHAASPIGTQCARRCIRRGERLYGAGDAFRLLYVVRVGVLKSFILSNDGLMQVTGFPMVGDAVGLDGVCTGRHQNAVVALEDAEVFVLPFAQCERWAQASPDGQHLMLRTLAQEIARGQEQALMIGVMRADQRVAAFLLELSVRYQRLGYSPSNFVMRMTRHDIGSFLGLKLETVSRLLSRLHHDGLIQIQGKSVWLLDFPALWRLSGLAPESRRHGLDSILDREGNLPATE